MMIVGTWPVVVFALNLFAYFRHTSTAYKRKVAECGGLCSLNFRNDNNNNKAKNGGNNFYLNSTGDGISASGKRCYFTDQTLECENRSRNFVKLSQIDKIGFNDSVDSLENVTFSSCPYNAYQFEMVPYIYNDSDHRPHVRINVTISTSDKLITAVALRQMCLSSSPNVDEELCKNHSRPAWGRFYWPCRFFDFTLNERGHVIDLSKSEIVFPITAFYDCYRAADLSLMSVQVSVYPQLCSNAYNYRMPTLHHVIGKTVDQWLPLMYVDTRDVEGVRIRFNRPPPALADVLSTVVVELIDERTGDVIRSKTVNSGKSEAFITDLKRGRYSALLHVWHSGCQNHKCLTGHVPFNLSRDYVSRDVTSSIAATPNVWLPAFVSVVFIVLLLIVATLALAFYFRKRISRRRRNPLALNFVNRPKVFLVYTDDSVEHRRSVILLAEYLRDVANCSVLLDEWSFRNHLLSRTTTTEWVYRSASNCDYFLLVFSDGARSTFENPRLNQLKPERPFGETFGLSIVYALEAVMRETQRDARTKLSNIICCTFAYSAGTCTPALFKSLPCRNYRIPDELAPLICHLHKLPEESLDPTSSLGCSSLVAQVDRTLRYYESNPNWLNERLIHVLVPTVVNPTDNERYDDDAQNGSSTIGHRSDREFSSIFAAIESLQTRYLRNNGYGPVEDSAVHDDDSCHLEDLYIKTKGASKGDYPLLPPQSIDDDVTESRDGAAPSSASRYALLPPDDDDLHVDVNSRSDFPLLKLNPVVPANQSGPLLGNDFTSSTDNLNDKNNNSNSGLSS